MVLAQDPEPPTELGRHSRLLDQTLGEEIEAAGTLRRLLKRPGTLKLDDHAEADACSVEKPGLAVAAH
jgi:hypothetical protein